MILRWISSNYDLCRGVVNHEMDTRGFVFSDRCFISCLSVTGCRSRISAGCGLNGYGAFGAGSGTPAYPTAGVDDWPCKLAEKVHQFNLGVGAKDICRDFFSFTPKALLEKIERGAARILEILQRAHVLIQAGGDAPQSLADAVRTGSLMLMMEQRVLISRRLQKSMALVRERCDKVK